MENVKDNEIDLRLALGVANQRVETFSNRDAGANANSRLRTESVLGHRPLPELVWSTQNGLSIKCVCNSCVAGMKPCIFGDVVASPSQHDEKCMFEESVKSAIGPLSIGQTAVENDGEVKCVKFIEMETHNKGKGKECMSIPVGNVIGTSEGNIGLMRHITESPSRGPAFLEKVEETAENDLIENTGEYSSGESVESCNSASKKNKRTGFEHELISTSKRFKKHSQECGVVKKHDSSFMSWISNMVKPYQQEERNHPVDDDKTLKNVVSKIFGFRSVFQSLYLQRLEQTKTQMDSSKEIILFDHQKSTDDKNSDLKPTASTSSAGCKKAVALTSSYEVTTVKRATPMSMRTCFFCGKTSHESHACLQITENKNVFLKTMKVSNLNKIGSTSENKLVKQDKILSIPKEMFDTVRRLRLSRTYILKWMNSCSTVTNLDGYFLRLRLAKWEEGVGEAGYYVACITDENPSKGSKQPIRVNIGGVQCLVECRYISNCDFLEDELIAWWRTTLESGRSVTKEGLTSKLEEKKKLGLGFL